jgi:uncharacterized protein YdaT
MSGRKVYHVVHSDEGWKIKLEGSERASAIIDNKQKAIDCARDLAKNAFLGQVKIHKMNGRIETEYTYGQDPEKYKG